jgi:cathepsin D
MYGPPDDVAAVYKAIGGTPWKDGLYSLPCDSPQSISFNWGGQDWEFDAFRGETEKGSGQCVGALSGQDTSLKKGFWLLGDGFMKNVYTAFSYEEAAVGFANLK